MASLPLGQGGQTHFWMLSLTDETRSVPTAGEGGPASPSHASQHEQEREPGRNTAESRQILLPQITGMGSPDFWGHYGALLPQQDPQL